jgi:flagellar hook-associated protein 1 FlgK
VVSLNGLLGIAGEAMAAQSAGVSIAGQNVANVNTPGYVRRSAVLETRRDNGGVAFVGVARAFDRFATGRVVSESGLRGAADARAFSLSTLQSTLVPTGSPTIGDRIQSLFGSFTKLAQSPTDVTTRKQALGAAEDLAADVRGAATALVTQRGEVLGRATAAASEVNQRLSRIADLNEKVALATASGDGAEALRDERDQLVREVGERIGVKSLEDSMGRVTLLSSGSTLVEGSNASKLAVSTAKDGTMKVEIHRPEGSVVDVTSNVDAGEIGGLREVHDVDIPDLQGRLDQLAYDLAGAMNAVHQQGVGLDKQGGRDLFAPPAKKEGAAAAFAVDPAVVGKPDALGAAKAVGDLPGGNDVALALAALASKPLGQAQSPAAAWGDVTGTLGTKVASADAEAALRKDTVAQAETMREGASGVSVDEEMVNLSKFQRAFQASVKVLQTADELLAGLIQGR